MAIGRCWVVANRETQEEGLRSSKGSLMMGPKRSLDRKMNSDQGMDHARHRSRIGRISGLWPALLLCLLIGLVPRSVIAQNAPLPTDPAAFLQEVTKILESADRKKGREFIENQFTPV